MTQQPPHCPQVSQVHCYFRDLTLLYPVPDAEDQHTQSLSPLTPSITWDSFPEIVIEGASDPLLIKELNSQNTPVMAHYYKALATAVWSSMFQESVAQLPTNSIYWKFIATAGDHELTFNPAWQPEEGVFCFVLLFTCKLICS